MRANSPSWAGTSLYPSHISSPARYVQGSLKSSKIMFKNEAWRNTSASWDKYLQPWGSQTHDSIQWYISIFVWDNILWCIIEKTLLHLDSSPSLSPSYTPSTLLPEATPTTSKQFPTLPGLNSLSYCNQVSM